jgi:hypothetical protein
MAKFSKSLTLVSMAVVLMTGYVFAQGGATGAITGTVTDPTGAYVANADVRILDQATGVVARTLKTDANGGFTAPLLPVGTYTVTVNSPGFSEAKFANIAVRVTETTRMTAKVAPLKVMEKVEVQAEVQSVETTTATTGQAIESQTIRELPLATQNFEQLLSLSTGAQSDLNASTQLGRGNVRILVNGQREDNNNYLVDGISVTDYNVAQATNIPLPNPDVIQEFKTQTSLYDASQGRNSGGNVNAIMKSGTNQFHGDAYEFLRNDVLNANDYFLNRAGQKRPPVKQNIFGGSFGGPIGHEGKLGYFFLNYQGTRQRSGLSPGTLVSTTLPVIPQQRDDAHLEAAFGVPSIDPVVHNLLNFKSNQFGNSPGGYLIPSIPGIAGSTGQFIVSSPGKYTDNQFTSNWDKEFNAGKDKLSAHFFFSDSEQLLPFGAGGLQSSLGGTLGTSISATDLNFGLDLPVHNRLLTIDETHLFSNTVINDFRFGWNHINDSLDNIAPVGTLNGGTPGPLTAQVLGIDRPTSNLTSDIYKFTLASFQIGPTPYANQHQNQNNYTFNDTISWVRGNHTLRFGGEYTRVNLDKLFPQVFNGQLFFVPTDSAPLSDFRNFLTGTAQASFGGGGVFNHQYRNNNFGFFGQDDWKVRQNLTLNLGLRTEVFGAFYDNLCHIGNFDLLAGNSGQYPFVYGRCAKGLNVAGLTGGGNNTTLRNNYSTTLGPRIGFAWDVFNDHKTSVRGGFGMYYVREDVGSVDQLSFQAPFLPIAGAPGNPGCLSAFFSANAPAGCDQVAGVNLNALPAAGVIDPNFVPCAGVLAPQAFGTPADTTTFPSYTCASGSPGLVPAQDLFVLAVPRHYVVPATQSWNLTIQRDLGRNWVMEIGYVGDHSIHLRETSTPVQAKLATAANPIFVTGSDGVTYKITESTSSNAVARSNLQGVNGYGGMQIFANNAYSHYNSLQTSLTRRWGAGYFQAAYTFSKALDATSTGNTAFNTAFNDESNIANSYGLSDFDRTHRLTVSYRYDLPFFAQANGFKNKVLGDWSISGITTAQSGQPFSVLDSGAGSAYIANGLAFATLGATLAPGATVGSANTSGSVEHRLDGYLNINNFTGAPFADPSLAAECMAAGVNAGPECTRGFGNLRRNLYRGPFEQNWDFSLIKNFRITERQQLRFTTDFFNIWNHPNFANPAATDIENPGAFAKIVSTVGNPRLIQFSLRYAF